MTYWITGGILLTGGLLFLIFMLSGRNKSTKENNVTMEKTRTDSMENLMEDLARKQGHISCGRKCSRQMLRKTRKHWRNIRMYHRYVRSVPNSLLSLVPSAQWLIDNFYVVNREVKVIQRDFNIKSYRTLPAVKEGPFKGYPVIYLIVRELLNVTDTHLDEDNIVNLLTAYQSVKPLTIAELWAFSDVLKICLIESISEICKSIIDNISVKRKAGRMMDEIFEKPWAHEDEVAQRLMRRMEGKDVFDSKYLVHVLFRLKEIDVEEGFLKQCLMDAKCGEDLDIAGAIRSEARQQAALQVSISSAITSLIQVSAIDWEKLFEKISVVEAILSRDPSGVYPKMDFSTRDAYHHEVEKMAENIGVKETQIAESAVRLSLNAESQGQDHIRSHVGYYILGKGSKLLEDSFSYRPGIAVRLTKWVRVNPGYVYFPSAFVIIAFISVPMLRYLLGHERRAGWAALTVAMFFTIVLSSAIALEIVNYIFARCIKPRKLPSMDFEKGIPDEHRTMVVMPVIIGSAAQLKKYMQSMEAYYLANRDRNLFFAVLGDFTDAKSKELPEDTEIIQAGDSLARHLNFKYTGKEDGPFYFFLRSRKWNKNEGRWMGWERKRGKLEEFNCLLLGQKDTSYDTIIGDTAVFPTIRYIITVDADTELTKGSAARLAGMMAHPLNRPVLSKDGSTVEEGYTLLQPRVGVRANSVNASLFSRTFAGQAGVDPYTNAVSDIYQDAFAEGSFTGKGIYDLRVFHRILTGTLPENAVLSHDLLEGSFVRCALVTDVELMDGYPSTVISFFSREHRWVRGDWQLLPWILGKDSLSTLSRWKMLDNLRRSLVAPSQLGLVLLGAAFMNWNAWVWMALVLSSMLFSLVIHLSGTAFLWLRKCRGETYISNLAASLITTFIQGFLLFLLIPYRAYVNLDAIIRALYRLLVSHRKMLEWKTAESVEKSTQNSLQSYVRKMWAGPFAGALLAVFAGNAAAYAAALLWIFSPAAAYLVSRPDEREKKHGLKHEEMLEIRCLARKTWRYFEEFFHAQDHWLTPDNYQVYPGDVLDRRASPTNIGMQLLSALSARDLGYIGINEFTDRLEKVFSTLSKMKLWHGHLYNWYDTRTLDVIYPCYVSTVDSGNFITSTIALRSALEEIKDIPILGRAQYEGLLDAARLSGKNIGFGLPESGKEWKAALEALEKALSGERVLPSGTISPEADGWEALLLKQCRDLQADIETLGLEEDTAQVPSLSGLCSRNRLHALELIKKMDTMVEMMTAWIRETDFRPLYDSRRSLFRVGFNVSANLPDNSYYDLMASEARLTSFIAIAKGDIPQRHWFKLGRPLTLYGRKAVLVSWSGTMFEYLLPNLLMKVFPGTLLEQTCRMAVKVQMDYGRKKNVPWGISESGYYRFDQMLNYQYRAFGVPKLGFRSDLNKSLVVAPYATLLAISIAPRKAYQNILLLKSLHAEGKYGFYEALDFISPIVKDPKNYKLIQSFMIHHQGMSLAAMNNFLNNDLLARRFHKDPMVKGTELLLEERQPCGIIVQNDGENIAPPAPGKFFRKKREPRVVKSTKLKFPAAHVLSNNRYSVMITGNGNGLSTLNDMAVNRWKPALDSSGGGLFFYIRNTRSRKYWSAAYLPSGVEPDSYRAVFSPDKAEFRRMDGHIETRTEIVVSPEHDLEIRRITLINRGMEQVNLEVTSYFEPIIDALENDIAHPAFSKLFVSTEYIEDMNMLIATRRPRMEKELRRYVFHAVSVRGKMNGEVEYETDRAAFIGRGNTLALPQALKTELPLSGTVGNVLDPAMSLRANVTVSPGRSAVITYVTGAAGSREKAVEMGLSHRNAHVVEDTFKMAYVDSEVEMQYLGITSQQVNTVQDLVGSIYYPSRLMRAPAEILESNTMGQTDLWKFGISGDYPIILFRISDVNHMGALKEAVSAYEYLRKNGVKLDFIVLNEENDDYFQPLGRQIGDVLSNRKIYYPHIKNQGLFLLKARNISQEEIRLLLTAARIVLSGKSGIMGKKIRKLLSEEVSIPTALPEPSVKRQYAEVPLPPMELAGYNGMGGFSRDGTEYVILLKGEHSTPAPWVNVIANDSFGFLISASGAGYTWSVNSRENKITGWSNDPVTDPVSEAIYIRDEATGEIFSPVPAPIRGKEPYRIRHGFGYSVFEHGSHGLLQTMTVYAGERDPVKIYRLRLENKLEEARDISLYLYVEWVMGVAHEFSGPYIVTHMDEESNIMTARNTYSTEYKGRAAFITCSEKISSYTGDRRDFTGTGGRLERPQALLYKELSQRTGAGLEPCGVIKADIRLKPGDTKEIIFILGEAGDEEAGFLLAEKYRRLQAADHLLDKVKSYWKDILTQIQVKTPDENMNRLLNGWLLYQVIGCRLKARSAFYQSGGAFGFRDQLQDVLALLHTEPHICREQILRCCGRQFEEGDVQHWWHNDSGKGVRTRISDDLLWLPYVTSEYVKVTGDTAVLEQLVHYLEGAELEEEESEKYFIPSVSEERDSVYGHCRRAIERALKLGERGLPLMGSGDWNDGMNRVGWRGRGESVWLAWFLYKVLNEFIPICRLMGDEQAVSGYEEAAGKLVAAVEENAWDGEWYMRAFFDSGAPLGSRQNQECRIDSISQSWGVISKGADPKRARMAMESVRKFLVKEEDQIALLLAPPFDKNQPDPGYIRSYLPGIRENGGQYTHAAVWNVMAFAALGDGDAAYEIFRMLNPLNHTRTYSEVMKYKLEPYVMPADIYSRFPHAGRGGWSWYTGSAAWMYQAGIGSVLGICRLKDRLFIQPVLPREWTHYSMVYRYGRTLYLIDVENTGGKCSGSVSITADGMDVTGEGVLLVDDGREHRVRVKMQGY